MPSRLLLLACAGAALLAAEPAAGPPPWTPSFTTQVRGVDRQFVEHAGGVFMVLRIDELVQGFGDGQEVALTGKLRRLPGDKLGLYRADGVELAQEGEPLAGRLEGDNVHLMGSLRGSGSARTFTVRHAAAAPSDAHLLAERMAGIPDTDWDRRLGVVNWCRDQARSAGNADFWLATADSLLARIVEDLAVRGGERKDLALVVRGLELALGQLRDPVLAARICSPSWIREHGGPQAEVIARRMRGLGFALYKEEWLPRPQALEREFEERFAALVWQDAEGFYRLGRWVDDHAEALPRSRERSWRCYQAGFAADPSHVGIARELGVQPRARGDGAATGRGAAAPAADVVDADTGLRIPAPPGWRMGPPAGGSATWADPNSETAHLLARTVTGQPDVDSLWSVLSEEAANRPGFVEIGSSNQETEQRRSRFLRYSWTEGEQQRFAALTLTVVGETPAAAVVEARGLPGEQSTLDAVLEACVSGIFTDAPQNQTDQAQQTDQTDQPEQPAP